jgi:hypothetical protein
MPKAEEIGAQCCTVKKQSLIVFGINTSLAYRERRRAKV